MFNAITRHRAKYTKVACYYRPTLQLEPPSQFEEVLLWVECLCGDDYFLDEKGASFNSHEDLFKKWPRPHQTDIYFRKPEEALQFKLVWGDYTVCPKD